MRFDDARAVADAVLFEGYALYPYRASTPKNRMRWQFGVVAPRGWSEAGGGDAWWQETQCLVRPASATTAATISGKLRFLRLRPGATAAAGEPLGWDQGEVQEIDFAFALTGGAAPADRTIPFTISVSVPAGGAGAPGETRTWPISGAVRVSAEPLEGPEPLARLRVRVENLSGWTLPGAPRDEAMRASLLGVHVLLGVSGGRFLSLLDPPPWAAAAAEACRNIRTYPVLAGPAERSDLLLSAPVILYDHPAVAPESPGDLFDATEIDEILTLRILTLTDDEKREVRSTDPRLAALLDRVEGLDPQAMARLHGAMRELRPLPVQDNARQDEPPAPSGLLVDGHTVGPGSRVRLRPGPRRTDAQDMFLAGLTATVESVMRDVEGRDCLAVSVDGDPATELLRWHGRFLYFYPDEVEPLDVFEPLGRGVKARVLIAGIGNVFLGDDGFGVEVAKRLAAGPLPAGVEVQDFGIRALHLAFALLDAPPLLIVVDAVGRGDPPGTLSVIEPALDKPAVAAPAGGIADGHGMSLSSVFAALRDLEGMPPRTLLVGCEPASLGEDWGLSPVVAGAVPRAVRMVLQLARHQVESAASGAAEEMSQW